MYLCSLPYCFLYLIIPMFSPCFFKIYSKYSWIFDTEHDPSGNSNLSFHVGADNLNLLLLYKLFMFFYVQWILRFDKAIIFSPFLIANLSVGLSVTTCGSEVLLFSEFVKIVSIFITECNFIECYFIVLIWLCDFIVFLVISFEWYKQFVWFHLINYLSYCLFSLVQELLTIFELFV